jgi:hypothetical protein
MKYQQGSTWLLAQLGTAYVLDLAAWGYRFGRQKLPVQLKPRDASRARRVRSPAVKRTASVRKAGYHTNR